MMMVMHGSNILINQGILSIMMMMCVRTQLTGASLPHRAASLCEHHYFVVFLAHQRWGRCHTYFHQRLLESNAWALKGGEVATSDWIQTVQVGVIVGAMLLEITETVLVLFRLRVLLLVVLIVWGLRMLSNSFQSISKLSQFGSSFSMNLDFRQLSTTDNGRVSNFGQRLVTSLIIFYIWSLKQVKDPISLVSLFKHGVASDLFCRPVTPHTLFVSLGI